ncbi:glycosyltransferase 87 family protein [Agreia sp. COWG]|uniref:glycosyltransferase 87 family protein n=1 Tax=Agreia sp. COWG TaxID=2773266 RepID=UPI0019288F84|nr:glycosyltransferase 87 family protein [Agreia sp. COWG]
MRQWLVTISTRPAALWAVFLVVHLWLAYVGLTNPTLPWGDVTLQYRPWVERALGGDVVGVSEPWVYPLVALVPMIAAMVLGPELYGVGWFLVVLVTNAVVLAFLLARSGPGARLAPLKVTAAWWWLAFLLLLGPIALGRIDATTVAIAIIALLIAAKRPLVAGVLLAVATWIKVWPAVLIAVVVTVVRQRVKALVGFVASAVALGVLVLIAGSGANTFGFVSQQSSRGLQIEAPVSTPWMWLSLLDPSSSSVAYIRSINTFQVSGPGTELASAVMTPLLVIVSAAVLVLGALVVKSGARPARVLAPLSLAIVVGLLLFNKVGSPQFVLWLAAPVVLGVATSGRHFRVPALLVLGTAALTQIIYPFGYDALLASEPAMLLVLTVRNVLLAVIFVVAVLGLLRLRHGRVLFHPRERQKS